MPALFCRGNVEDLISPPKKILGPATITIREEKSITISSYTQKRQITTTR